MNLAPQSPEEPDVNLTPMIDVVFLLLLFFMVSTSFIRESSLKVNLPEGTGETSVSAQQEQIIEIIINLNGQFTINGNTLDNPSRKQLFSHLKQAVGELKDPHIIIKADAKTEYQNIVTTMAVVGKLDSARLTLITQPTSDTP